jgi:hypothetical protein
MPLWAQEYVDYQNPYWQLAPGITSSSCYKQWTSFFYQWIETVDTRTLDTPLVTSLIWTTIDTTWYVSDTTTTFAFLTDTPTTYETLQTSLISLQGGNRDFTASPPCCFHCTFAVGDVQVYHWPSQAPKISTLTNTAGYTL